MCFIVYMVQNSMAVLTWVTTFSVAAVSQARMRSVVTESG
jgi:hypothetical protein